MSNRRNVQMTPTLTPSLDALYFVLMDYGAGATSWIQENRIHITWLVVTKLPKLSSQEHGIV